MIMFCIYWFKCKCTNLSSVCGGSRRFATASVHPLPRAVAAVQDGIRPEARGGRALRRSDVSGGVMMKRTSTGGFPGPVVPCGVVALRHDGSAAAGVDSMDVTKKNKNHFRITFWIFLYGGAVPAGRDRPPGADRAGLRPGLRDPDASPSRVSAADPAGRRWASLEADEEKGMT